MARVFRNSFEFLVVSLCFLCVFYVHKLLFHQQELTLVIAAFGASSVLAFSEGRTVNSPVKMFASSMLGAFLGVFCSRLDTLLVVKIMLAIGLCIALMSRWSIQYPPAGAIALIPILSGPAIQELGYWFLVYPTLTGLFIIYSFSKLKHYLNSIFYGQ